MAEVFGERAGRGADGGSDRPTVRLPPRRSSFVGRAAELGEIAARLGRYTVVTLVGAGGVGKTALAVEAAWSEVSAGRAELACCVDLVPCRTGDQVITALVEGVGIRGAQAAAGLDAVVDALSGGRSLLVIDNCEHVLESVRHACDRLAGRIPGLRLLVTSRIPLDVEPGCVRRVPPMAVPDEAGPPVVTEAVAMAFEHDCWFPPRVVREAAQRIAGCQYVELTGLGHGAPLLAPREVNPVIARFLD